jgi:hypothetical protein
MASARRAGCLAGPLLAAFALAGCAELAPPAPPVPAPPAAEGPGRAAGTLTVGGKTTALSHAYASAQRDPDVPGREYLVVLLADRAVSPVDRDPTRLAELARTRQTQAVRVIWREGTDDVLVALYHPQLVQSGLAFREQSVLSVNALNQARIEGDVRSKTLGQPWAFTVAFAADIARGGVAAIEPLAPAAAPAPAAGPVAELGRRGYEFTEEALFHAISKGDPEAVRLFLGAGMSPNATPSRPAHPAHDALMFAIGACPREPVHAHHDIVLVLIRARANVNVRDGNNATPIIWAADKCGPPVIQALIDAGADVNARANGGGTALMLAEVLGKTENAAILRKAGALPWAPAR